MSDCAVPISNDKEVIKLIRAKDNDAVLKYRLERISALRSIAHIFAFEGQSDKIVFSRWIHRINDALAYEPFVCEGKRGVAKLKRIANRDIGDLRNKTFFFVDRDFDDLSTFDDDFQVFMTGAYSIENYLVCPTLLDAILRDEFPCHERPEIRGKVIALFERDYLDFLRVTAPLNARIFVARRLKIAVENHLSTVRLSKIAAINLGSVDSTSNKTNDLVRLEREPTYAEGESLVGPFFEMEPRDRYRGKFAYAFLQRWIHLLIEEFTRDSMGLFEDIVRAPKPNSAEITFGSLAAKSKLPSGLQSFILAI